MVRSAKLHSEALPDRPLVSWVTPRVIRLVEKDQEIAEAERPGQRPDKKERPPSDNQTSLLSMIAQVASKAFAT